MKNWDLFESVSFPELAIATTPRALNCASADQSRNKATIKLPTQTDLERGLYFVGEWCAPDALTSLASVGRVAGLDYETAYVAMEYTAIVIARSTESKKILPKSYMGQRDWA